MTLNSFKCNHLHFKGLNYVQHHSGAATSSSERAARRTTPMTKLASSDANVKGSCGTVRRALLALHASSLQQVVQTEVPVDVVMPLSHVDCVSFTCRLHDVFIVHILLIDNFSLTSTITTSPPSSTTGNTI